MRLAILALLLGIAYAEPSDTAAPSTPPASADDADPPASSPGSPAIDTGAPDIDADPPLAETPTDTGLPVMRAEQARAALMNYAPPRVWVDTAAPPQSPDP